MKMKISTTYCLLITIGFTWRETISTCVLESDFGFTLNCAFKKSGLFRVRNLGGVKGYLGLGLTIGDELGFTQSLSNIESNKRRSVQTRGNVIPNGGLSNGVTLKREDSARVQGVRRQVPPFKPLPPGASRPMTKQPERQRLVVQQNSTALRTVPAPSFESIQQQQQQLAQTKLQAQQIQMQIRQNARVKQQQQQRNQEEALALQMLKQQRLQQQEVMRRQQLEKLAEQNQLREINLQTKRVQVAASSNQVAESPVYSHKMQINGAGSNGLGNYVGVGHGKPSIVNVAAVVADNGLPGFVAMPQSMSQLTDRISNSPTIIDDSVNQVSNDDYATGTNLAIPREDAAASVNEMTLQSFRPVTSVNSIVHQSKNDKHQSSQNLPSLAPIQGVETSLKALAEASNITLEALEAAIMARQQQFTDKRNREVFTTTTTTTQAPVKSYNNPGMTKVMNAPREYYPNGYDKNFDDNFASRVDLPDTSFYCGDQKHFPGLYADQDLGCMVFHVCALTDDGLIMKSFLCPESTLFDQTILKCNWWFYVDCKSSKNLYDSNIPISKSYQLMKALAFFSAYKNHDNSTGQATEIQQS